ncbi:ferredoxin [Marinobacterium iners]|jgi:ferredoxin|uniref:2Fe-2S iron-sulfur cluster binding domain-containing protein n=1 Tax=Marinobacterium iners DSM 11526 TaxID=1122198 RepID=A0A1H4BQQ9_9GAMM|nr:2Fe-2S iron-sulfur cluster binding domain-containing protein [Marinobacterium iners]QSR36085.1 ferredoxin [Marinobacterium iners]SEA50400.1 2Fe-2S iron-sulfur cluster binding domain-containing protein [Marinobacterium iners DSM 11526]
MNNNYNASTPETPQRHRIELTDEETSFNASSELSLLVAMERAGQALIPVGCRGGGCGKCRIRILKGEYFSKRMSRAWVSPEQEAEGTVLACRVYARSNLTIEPDPPEVATSCGKADRAS